jgi:hypothetical protein
LEKKEGEKLVETLATADIIFCLRWAQIQEEEEELAYLVAATAIVVVVFESRCTVTRELVEGGRSRVGEEGVGAWGTLQREGSRVRIFVLKWIEISMVPNNTT